MGSHKSLNGMDYKHIIPSGLEAFKKRGLEKIFGFSV